MDVCGCQPLVIESELKSTFRQRDPHSKVFAVMFNTQRSPLAPLFKAGLIYCQGRKVKLIGMSHCPGYVCQFD